MMPAGMDSNDFYADLPAFPNFNEVTGDKPFRPLPADWKIIVADMKLRTSSPKRSLKGNYGDSALICGAAD